LAVSLILQQLAGETPGFLLLSPMTVSGLTRIKAERQSRQVAAKHAQKNRSEAVSFGRLTERWRTLSWCRRASTSI